MFAGMKVLMTNTSTPYHRGGMMNAPRHVHAMRDKCVYLRIQELERPSLLTHNALGIMVHLQSLPRCPMHAIKKAMQTFWLLVKKMTKTNARHEQ